jgi:hypothetical protein
MPGLETFPHIARREARVDDRSLDDVQIEFVSLGDLDSREAPLQAHLDIVDAGQL